MPPIFVDLPQEKLREIARLIRVPLNGWLPTSGQTACGEDRESAQCACETRIEFESVVRSIHCLGRALLTFWIILLIFWMLFFHL